MSRKRTFEVVVTRSERRVDTRLLSRLLAASAMRQHLTELATPTGCAAEPTVAVRRLEQAARRT